MSNTTTNMTFNVLAAPAVIGTDTGKQNLQNNNLLAWSNSTKVQIDDLIGFTKSPTTVISTVAVDPYVFYHWLQFSTSSAPVASNVLTTWVAYQGWDSVANYSSSSSL